MSGDQLKDVERIGIGMAGRLDINAGMLVYSPPLILEAHPSEHT